MDKYYYFVATLPMLFFGREAGINNKQFLVEAQKWLSAKDYDLLAQLDMSAITSEVKGNKVVQHYSLFEAELKNDIANWRKAIQRNLDYKPETVPASLLKEGNPLEVEMKLLKLKWDRIDQMERDHDFDLGFVVLYYLKLQILQRYLTFDKERGLEKFQKLYEVSV